MRWLPFIAIFLYVYIEISIFIQVAHVLGVLLTLVLVIFTSVIGMSLVRNQGFKNFVLMQQKMAAGENPAAEMIKSVSLVILLMVSTSERMMSATALIIKTIARINVETPDYVVMPFSGVFRFGRNSHNPASMISA